MLTVIAIIVLVVIFICMKRRVRLGEDNIQKLVRQTARWATAAKQDESPLIALLHANYAAGYLWALKDIATPSEIEKSAGIDLKRFEKHITEVQDGVTQKVVKKCPQFSGEVDLYLSTIAGENPPLDI